MLDAAVASFSALHWRAWCIALYGMACTLGTAWQDVRQVSLSLYFFHFVYCTFVFPILKIERNTEDGVYCLLVAGFSPFCCLFVCLLASLDSPLSINQSINRSLTMSTTIVVVVDFVVARIVFEATPRIRPKRFSFLVRNKTNLFGWTCVAIDPSRGGHCPQLLS